MNDTYKHIDLSCLDSNDAIMITKHKIFDLASKASTEHIRKNLSREVYIINIKCSEDNLMIMEDEYGRQPLKNCILEMIKKDLGLDHYYISAQRTILLKVDSETIKINEFN